MSHYTVMVVGDGDLEEMLAPFEESPEDKRLLVFEDIEVEKRKFYETEKREFVKLEDGTVLSKYDSRFRVQTGLVSHEYQWPENSLVELPLKEAYPTFEAFMEDWGEERDEESGKWGYWHNPEKFKVTICKGLSNPKVEGIGGNERTERLFSSRRAEEVPYVWTDQTTRLLCDSAKEQGRTIHILSAMYDCQESDQNPGTPTEVAPYAKVQDYSRAVSGVGYEAGREMCNLPRGERGEGTEREMAGSGSLSQDWGGERAFVYEVQHAAGPSGGHAEFCSCGSTLPHTPHIIKRTLIGGGKWDWWQVGGRWTGFFKAKPGVESEQGTPGLMTPRAEVGYADRIRKGDIDFEGMRDEACKGAFERYDRFVRLVGLPPGTEPWVMAPWKTWKQVIEENPEAEREELRAIYFSQDVLQRLEEAKQNRDALDEDLRDAAVWLDADSFAMTQDQYVLNARNAALATFAMLKDGEWYERGKMGWWGMVSDENSEWLARFNELLDSLPDDTLLTVVDCHI